MTVIAITREIGTRGLDVANGLGKRLSLNVVNDELIERDIATLSGVNTAAVHRYFDGTAPLLERWRTDERRLSKSTTEEVIQLAAMGNVVIRGWGASYLLQNVSHVLCVRICAPMQAREKIVIERGLEPDAETARSMIDQRDAANDKVMKRMFGRDGRDAAGYSMILNSARLGVEQCIEQIVLAAALRRFQATVESQRALLDWLTDLRVYERHTA